LNDDNNISNQAFYPCLLFVIWYISMDCYSKFLYYLHLSVWFVTAGAKSCAWWEK